MTGKIRRRASLCGWAAAIAVGLSACSQSGAYVGPGFPFLPSYKGAPRAAPVLLGNADWWRRMNDPVLDRLVDLALQGNLSLDIARQRVVQAEAELRSVPGSAALTPSLGLQSAGGSARATTSRGTATLGLDWFLDPYGARRADLKLAGARIDIADAEVDAARLLVLSGITNAYVDLRYRQRVLELRNQERRGRQQTLAATRQLLDADSTTRLEITRSEARVAEIEAQLPDLRAAIAARRNEIAVLAGMAPGTLPGDLGAALDRSHGQPLPDLSPDVGIPTDLLRNRPDIRIAERSYYAALAEVEKSKIGLYPRLSLTGAITLNAPDRGRSSTDYYFGPSLQFPGLPLRAGRAGVEVRASAALQAQQRWKSIVLTAILEVENALLDYNAVSTSLTSARKAARLYREALDLTRDVFSRGNATLGDLIDAEQAVANADQALAEALLRRAQGFISLNVRLGAGNAGGQDTARQNPAEQDVAE